jgi:SAM-dependent methyltransferase
MGELSQIETYLALSDRERAADGYVQRRAAEAVGLAGLSGRADLLDLGSGQGWYSLELADRHRVTGVDGNERLIREACRRAGAVPIDRRPRFLVAESRELPLKEGSFDVAISLATCIGYGTIEEDRATFEELRRVLREDGALLLEATSAEHAEQGEEHERVFGDGARARYSPTFDPATQRLTETQRLRLPDGRRGEFGYCVRAYDPGQLLDLLEEAGFRRIRLAGSLEGSPHRNGDPLVVHASR